MKNSRDIQSSVSKVFVDWSNDFTTEEPPRTKLLVFILVPHGRFALVCHFNSVGGKVFLPIPVSAGGEVMTPLVGVVASKGRKAAVHL